MVTVLFTQGHISIKRGRVTRKYGYVGHDISRASFERLCHVLNYGPCEDGRSTQRSSIHYWHGRSTLNHAQIVLLDLYAHLVKLYEIEKEKVHQACKENSCYPFQTLGYESMSCRLDAAIACKDACIAAGIHSTLVESITPCQHGNIQSKCYTCYTTY